MSDIFVSYAHEDSARIGVLVNALTARGWSVFHDRKLEPGDQFVIKLQEWMDEARLILVCWSKDSIGSNWVYAEADIAYNAEEYFPILLDEVSPPPPFGILHAYNMSTWDGVTADSPEVHALCDQVASRLEKRRPSSTVTTTRPTTTAGVEVPDVVLPPQVAVSDTSRETPGAARYALLGAVSVIAIAVTSWVLWKADFADRSVHENAPNVTTPSEEATPERKPKPELRSEPQTQAAVEGVLKIGSGLDVAIISVKLKADRQPLASTGHFSYQSRVLKFRGKVHCGNVWGVDNRFVTLAGPVTRNEKGEAGPWAVINHDSKENKLRVNTASKADVLTMCTNPAPPRAVTVAHGTLTLSKANLN